HDADAQPFRLQVLRKPDRERSLAGSTDSDVADDYDGPLDPVAAKPAFAIRVTARGRDAPEEPRQRHEQHRQPGCGAVIPDALHERIGRSAHAANCIRWSDAYWPPRASSSACVPLSTTRPSSTTRMRSALSTVDRRCAMTSVVRLCMSPSS